MRAYERIDNVLMGLHCTNSSQYSTVQYNSYRESIMGARAERSSPEWVCIPEITSDVEWFLWNTNSQGWTQLHTGTHDWFYFYHNVFSYDNCTKTSEITLNLLEIMVRVRKSQLSVEECWIWYSNINEKHGANIELMKDNLMLACSSAKEMWCVQQVSFVSREYAPNTWNVVKVNLFITWPIKAWYHAFICEIRSVGLEYLEENNCLLKTGLILGLRPTNERRRYKVTPSLIGWAQT